MAEPFAMFEDDISYDWAPPGATIPLQIEEDGLMMYPIYGSW